MALKSFIVLHCLIVFAFVHVFFFLKLIWSSNTASQDSQINIYHLPQLWDCLRQRSLCLLPIRSCFGIEMARERRDERKKESEKSWQKCQKDYKYPFPSYGTSTTRAHRTHSARWPSWQACTLGNTGGRLSVSFPTAGAMPQITTKLGTWTSPPRSSASLCAP